MADIQRYLDNIESQHQSAPKYMATVTALLKKLDDAHTVIRDMPRAFSLESAVGNQLDVLGRLVGIDRRHAYIPGVNSPELLDDEAYRAVLRAQIVRNQWDGTAENFREIWNATLGAEMKATMKDNQNMSVDIDIINDVDDTLVSMIMHGEYLPKAMGVQINISVQQWTDKATAALYAMTALTGQSGYACATASM